MRNRPSRILAALAVVLLMATAGAIAGYFTGRIVKLNASEDSLLRYASVHSVDFERDADEAHEVLDKMNASPHPPCSEAQLGYFRGLVRNSRSVKDAGRMSGQQLVCSTTWDRADLPRTLYQPSFQGTHGASVYIRMESLRIGSLVPIVVRKGDSYVALDPYNHNTLPSGADFTLTRQKAAPGVANYLGGSHTVLPVDVLTRDNDGRMLGNLYATRCSKRYGSCLTVFVGMSAALREQRSQLAIWMVVGGLIGASFGVVCLLLYRRKLGIEQQLRRAIRQGSLRVVYQPLFDLRTKKILGAEALVRWTDEDNLAIPPDVFIKIAEEGGFVQSITRLVIGRVLDDFGAFLNDHPEFHVNVNVAACDLMDLGFPIMLGEALASAHVSARSLGIEITEGGTAQHMVAIEAIAVLRERGHRVYLDDFGTGYSSLAYLKDLAVDALKIDRTFTQAIGTEAVTVSILPQILAMAETLKLQVVAEGVENEAQADYYAKAALPIVAQGWLFGYPVPPEEFRTRWLSDFHEISEPSLARALRTPGDWNGHPGLPETMPGAAAQLQHEDEGAAVR